MVSAIFLFSCKKKNTSPAAFQWPNGTGEYAPYTLGSTFVYESTTTAPAATDSFTYTVTKDTTIEGLSFKKLESNKPNLASTFFCNINGGIRTEITYNTTFSGINVPIIKLETLKESVAASGTWSGSFNVTVPANPPAIPIPIPLTISVAYTLMQKDFTKNILAKDYVNTFHVKQIASLPASVIGFLPPGTPSSFQIENYFSKGVGLAQRDGPNASIKIKRYNVVK
jgi:hypothetical protein